MVCTVILRTHTRINTCGSIFNFSLDRTTNMQMRMDTAFLDWNLAPLCNFDYTTKLWNLSKIQINLHFKIFQVGLQKKWLEIEFQQRLNKTWNVCKKIILYDYLILMGFDNLCKINAFSNKKNGKKLTKLSSLIQQEKIWFRLQILNIFRNNLRFSSLNSPTYNRNSCQSQIEGRTLFLQNSQGMNKSWKTLFGVLIHRPCSMFGAVVVVSVINSFIDRAATAIAPILC